MNRGLVILGKRIRRGVERREVAMKVFLLALICAVMSGCVTLDEMRAINRARLVNLSIGMTKQKAIKIMGNKPCVCEGTTINNPYFTETIKAGEKTFETVYYYTDVIVFDNIITRDELTPLVFEDNKLIGWGKEFLKGVSEK